MTSINTNINALRASNALSLNGRNQQVTMQELSTGKRINRASDDAAGLSIRETMTAQITGLNSAIKNANDGISLAQVAEGGLSVVTDILQRMRELSVQAINSTNTSADISALNQEYGQLSQELARNMSSVEFNGTSLFTTTSDFTFHVGANIGQTVTVGSADLGVASSAITGVLPNSATTSGLDTLVNANNSANLSAIDLALTAVNSSRATLGAIQSRFSQTITYLQTAVENQTAARGRIMDADFAAETANLSRAQILQQAGTAMIAQANQMPQSVLQLLK